MIPLFVASLFLGLSLVAGLIYHSLREYSLSKLETICEENKVKERFSEIMKQSEAAHLAWESWLFIANLGFFLSLLWHATGPLIGSDTTAEIKNTNNLVLEILGGYFLLFILQIIISRVVARVVAERLLYRFWSMIALGKIALAPIVSIVDKLNVLAHRLAGLEPPEVGDGAIITEEILSAIDEGQREGVLESEAGTMIHRVMELSEDDVDSIMTPRTDMISIQSEMSLEQARIQLLEAGHSRVPVYRKNPDDIVGVLYAKDLLSYLSEHGNTDETPLTKIIREPLYIPESTGIDKLLQTMKIKRIHIAIVLDEYGGVAGLVTMEDILEEIVGEIDDEYDTVNDEPIQTIQQGVIEVDARVHIDDLNEQFDYKLPEDGDFDTIGGFVFNQLERVPKLNEQLTWESLRITVLEADKRKIVKLRIAIDESLAKIANEQA